ncbi:hypothetical protein KC19_6G040700 [Ceratodon purpureus]|uniref:Uncharacterized protein n=1 Tax=Ceratodon purpureus TaxID=3225 RepID=A0A8T0HEQ2_CERPU|nr:hypothetical protein KC19_6G040700 [Ceratodon purpureus]
MISTSSSSLISSASSRVLPCGPNGRPHSQTSKFWLRAFTSAITFANCFFVALTKSSIGILDNANVSITLEFLEPMRSLFATPLRTPFFLLPAPTSCASFTTYPASIDLAMQIIRTELLYISSSSFPPHSFRPKNPELADPSMAPPSKPSLHK